MKMLYGVLAVLGLVLPYGAFLPWLLDNSLDIPRLLTEAFSSRIGAFAWLDVLIAAIVLLVFIWTDGRRQGVRNLWLPTLGTCTVGVSFGLPLFLLMRTVHRDNQNA
ncbi:hypothetical protein BGP77_07350 [Saccharospirillum sp. MSK14-1]|uniref:DUF2834 domain-containing protein n=1 Tax=Saccharospirillum sp. MSK14-1 TaxID=1897632 RepID=UPI000D35E50F|nr:DUF2834 domain-containing protein [Saccharospirillum sp. MSK14-1]PTY37088.1 hypothetical protein BGP77_07350 [Saccharospirillum sp. MSK14-1]